MKKLLLIVALSVSISAIAEPLEDGAKMTIVGSIKNTKEFGVERGLVSEVQTFVLIPKQPSPEFEKGLTVKPAPQTGLSNFSSLPSSELAADCVIRLSRAGERPICELQAYASTKAAPSVSYEERQRQQQEETAEIKMRSFDRSTIGRTAFIFASPITEITPRSSMIAILYRDTPCRLPISTAKDMRAAESLYGRALVPACWGKIVTPTKDQVVIVTKFGDARRESLINYAEVKVQPDGSAQFIGPAMSRDEFMKNVDDYHKAIN